MEVNIEPGKYILAVSGGVDSVVLFDLLIRKPEIELVVAHFNHGIRDESDEDEVFVTVSAKRRNILCEVGHGKLGPTASEETARTARYNFLNQVKDKHEALGIITAHHQDDLIETAFINLLRGTGPKGLISMLTNSEIVRPMLQIPKNQILKYAKDNQLVWVEDKTNQDTKYLRNNIRAIMKKKLSDATRAEVLEYIEQMKNNYDESNILVKGIEGYLFMDESTLKRSSFIFLPHDVANEVVARWLRKFDISSDRPTIDRLSVAIKTAKAGSSHSINKQYTLEFSVELAYLEHLS